ncbi:hypothetical protein B7494_g2400 [Chlorociboria aeruginascens]|nr:hypothetical protein B7494_g2400 [Chlorociboria aeruginascens]
MQLPTLLLLLVTASTPLLAALTSSDSIVPARQSSNDEEAYLTSVCSPANVTDPLPPCISITSIETTCTPNGTLPLDYLAHAECICGGSFFYDWLGCLNCDYVHGGRSLAVSSAFSDIISQASNSLCSGTPTADFAAIFNSLTSAVAATGTDTAASDLFPSQSAVSLYFTETGLQGPGPITGSATAASKTGSGSVSGSDVTTVQSTSSVKTGSSGSVAAQTGSSSSSASSSSSSAGAESAGVLNGLGWGMVVGGVVIAGL